VATRWLCARSCARCARTWPYIGRTPASASRRARATRAAYAGARTPPRSARAVRNAWRGLEACCLMCSAHARGFAGVHVAASHDRVRRIAGGLILSARAARVRRYAARPYARRSGASPISSSPPRARAPCTSRARVRCSWRNPRRARHDSGLARDSGRVLARAATPHAYVRVGGHLTASAHPRERAPEDLRPVSASAALPCIADVSLAGRGRAHRARQFTNIRSLRSRNIRKWDVPRAQSRSAAIYRRRVAIQRKASTVEVLKDCG
jgi:hypothetical protein